MSHSATCCMRPDSSVIKIISFTKIALMVRQSDSLWKRLFLWHTSHRFAIGVPRLSKADREGWAVHGLGCSSIAMWLILRSADCKLWHIYVAELDVVWSRGTFEPNSSSPWSLLRRFSSLRKAIAPYGLRGGNASWFMCRFQRLFVCLIYFLFHFLPSWIFSLLMLSFLLIYFLRGLLPYLYVKNISTLGDEYLRLQ